jgi:hypothetical protein
MKHILFIFLLINIACFAQEKAHIMAYRLIEEDADGPCSVKDYAEYRHTNSFSNFVTAESNDLKLMKRLLEIQKKAPQWKSRRFYCHGGFNGDRIQNMITVSDGIFKDTIFTDKDFLWIIFPDKDIAYRDEKQLLKKALTGNIKDFFEHDFEKQLRAMFVRDEIDSLPIGALWYKGRSGTVFIHNFQRDPQGYSLVKTDSAYGEITQTYTQGKDSIEFYRNTVTLKIYDPETPWNIGMVKPGDPESKLLKLYPTSTKQPFFYNIRFEDIKRIYYYPVILKGQKGSISYCIKNKVIEEIDVYFY